MYTQRGLPGHRNARRLRRQLGEFGGQAKFGKLDIDVNPSTAEKYGVSSIPAIVIFKNGVVVESFVGVRPYERYQQAIHQLTSRRTTKR